MKRILVAEDNDSNYILMTYVLKRSYEFERAKNGQEAVDMALKGGFDLVLMDIKMPVMDGLEATKAIKEKMPELPVVALTANAFDSDRQLALEVGCDDFLTKPFSLAVLRARVNALIRRSKISAPEKPANNLVYELDDMVFDFEKLIFKKGDTELFLSTNEQKLLKVFLDNKGRILTRDMLIDRLWGNDGEFVDENALSVSINRLRGKIDTDKESKHINTVYGQGYKFE